MTLQTNRYGQTTPSLLNSNGVLISVPFYLNPTTDQKKELLNAFRTLKAKQQMEAGYDPSPKQSGGVSVVTASNPPQTPVEFDLGINEENLRLMLFARQGIQERLLLKLQDLTGVHVVSRQDVEEAYKAWLDHLFPSSNEDKGTKTTASKTSKRARTTKAAEAAVA